MKKLIYLLTFVSILGIGFVSCEKDKNKFLDPNAQISIKPAKDGWNKTYPHAPRMKNDITPGYLSPLEIVKQTSVLQHYMKPTPGYNGLAEIGFAESQRDTLSNPPRLKAWGTWIISQEGELSTGFIESTDMILVTKYHRDTIAYIPNKVMRAAEAAIKEAWAIENYDEVYRLFDEVFVFQPTTGAEYRALKANGEQ